MQRELTAFEAPSVSMNSLTLHCHLSLRRGIFIAQLYMPAAKFRVTDVSQCNMRMLFDSVGISNRHTYYSAIPHEVPHTQPVAETAAGLTDLS